VSADLVVDVGNRPPPLPVQYEVDQRFVELVVAVLQNLTVEGNELALVAADLWGRWGRLRLRVLRDREVVFVVNVVTDVLVFEE
jgi:hypothetical protein